MFEELINRAINSGSEQDFRLLILNALLQTPHRQVGPYIKLFNFVHDRDPLFFGQLAAWYWANGTVRDLKQLFVAIMVTSKFSEEFRSAGLAQLQKLPPFEVERVLGMIKGTWEKNQFIEGVSGSIPRCVKTCIEEYLRDREADHEQFDNVVMHARKSLKTLYASLRIKPGQYAQRVLFDNDPPENSRLYALKLIAKAEDPAEKARLIVEHKLPYRVAISGIKQVTPAILTALVTAMTPQEVINNLASLKKRGAMDDTDLRKLIEDKLEKGKSDKRVSALKTRRALQTADLDEELVDKVKAVGDAQIKTQALIKRSTAVLVDKSGSMQIAIEVGKAIAAMVAPICMSDLFVYAFDAMAYPIKANGTEMSAWEKAFKGIKAEGNTSCGVAVEMMRRNKQVVEQIVMVTDQGENTQPFLAPTLQKYSAELAVTPTVTIVHIGSPSNHLERALHQTNTQVDVFTFNGDYYSLPSLLPMLAGGTRLDLLIEIMSYPLPQRKVKAMLPA